MTGPGGWKYLFHLNLVPIFLPLIRLLACTTVILIFLVISLRKAQGDDTKKISGTCSTYGQPRVETEYPKLPDTEKQ
jgi:hypothetical protein